MTPQEIVVGRLLDIKTDEVMWSLHAEALQSIKEVLEFSDMNETAVSSSQLPSAFAELPQAEQEFRTAFLCARDRVTDAIESAVTLSRALEQGLADAFVRLGNAEARAVAAAIALEQTMQWQEAAITQGKDGFGPFHRAAPDWRDLMEKNGGYGQ